MNTKRIIILGGGFGGVKCAETLRDGIAAWPRSALSK
jgi:NADH dehydrogenase FAD-containing subunit